jgi:hypothetical protein
MDEPTATAIQFAPADASAPGGPWALRVFVTGNGFVARAIKLSAAVGAIPVQGIFLFPDSSGFAGYLATTPNDGDALSLGFIQPTVTNLVFHPADVA